MADCGGSFPLPSKDRTANGIDGLFGEVLDAGQMPEELRDHKLRIAAAEALDSPVGADEIGNRY